MSGINDLDATPLNDGVDVANLPEQLGSRKPLLPQGPYRFALPSTLKDGHFSAVESEKYGKRVSVHFDESAPLLVVQSTNNEQNGVPFETRISNVPRRRGKGDDAPVASDWDYLNQALGETTRPASNKEYATRLVARAAKQEQFSADAEWSWHCNEKRDAFFDNGEGGLGPAQMDGAEPGVNHKGCGKRYYNSSDEIASQKVDGKLPERITCPGCGANVRAFANLTRFRK